MGAMMFEHVLWTFACHTVAMAAFIVTWAQAGYYYNLDLSELESDMEVATLIALTVMEHILGML